MAESEVYPAPGPRQPIRNVARALRRTFDFNGRATRSEFWWFQLLWLIASFVLEWFDDLFFRGDEVESSFGFSALVQNLRFDPIYTLSDVVLAVTAWALLHRRLHDIGWPAAFSLLGGIYVLNPLVRFGSGGQYYDEYEPADPLATPEHLQFVFEPIDLVLVFMLVLSVFLLIVGLPRSKPQNRHGPNPWTGPLSDVFR